MDENRAKLIYSGAVSLPARAPGITMTAIITTAARDVKMGSIYLFALLVLLEGGTHTISPTLTCIWGFKLMSSCLCG